MPKIKHIALSTRDVDETVKFYVETFGLKEVGEIAERLTAAGSRRRHDVEQALDVGPGAEANVEAKWTGPDGVMLDVSETGWLGTSTFSHPRP